MVLLVRILLPVALVVAGALLIAFSISLVVGVALIVLAFFSVLTNFLIRLAISSQDDRDQEAAARERYVRTGRWTSR
ncbi:MAG: hypothetical protein ACYCUM_13450 [Solirubrobacteraceae bacterium]